MKTSTKTVGILFFTLILAGVIHAGSKKNPYMEEAADGQKLIIPDVLDAYLSIEFPGYRIPSISEFTPEMLAYYRTRLVGIHPGISWGDFNGDKKQDYALLIVTGDTKWGPLVEFVVLAGENNRDKFTTYRLGEIYNFKDDYIIFENNKLSKGKFKKSAWYVNWDKKEKTFVVTKS